MSNDFYKPIKSVRIFKRGKATESRERALRLYCSQSGRLGGEGRWELQVRGPMTLGNSGYGPEGKDFIIANASMGREELLELRSAIDACLAQDQKD